jgi:hypothetical protein
MNRQQRANAAAERKAFGKRFEPRTNLYVCSDMPGQPSRQPQPPCGMSLISVDLDEGVTPFMMGCVCGRMAYSSFYRVPDAIKRLPADIEWYKPTREETSRLSKPMRDHVKNGGLIFRVVSRRAEYLKGEEGFE